MALKVHLFMASWQHDDPTELQKAECGIPEACDTEGGNSFAPETPRGQKGLCVQGRDRALKLAVG